MPPFLHLLEHNNGPLPCAFTFPFRYTPHPLCVKAAAVVQQQLEQMGVTEGKMYGVMVVKGKRIPNNVSPAPSREGGEWADANKGASSTNRNTPSQENVEGSVEGDALYFLAAYSGQLNGSYAHPWFVPPVVDYLAPDSHFQLEQQEISEISRRMEALRTSEERTAWVQRLTALKEEREVAVTAAKRVYEEHKSRPNPSSEGGEWADANEGAAYIRMRQFQKANIHRAKQLHKEEIAALEARLAEHNATMHQLFEERKLRSEALQQWLFEQFDFMNGNGERKNLIEIFHGTEQRRLIPSGAGECCAPKLLQTAYRLGLEPVAMAEFWWGPSSPSHYRQPGAFFPACHSKCRPILGHMLQGLNVEPDPAAHYNSVLAPVRVVWEDATMAVIMKPEGWCSIPGRSDQANLFDEAHRIWPGITGSVVVHRLDQDTSGLMLIAKNAATHHALSQQFERREVHKRYVALLEGSLQQWAPDRRSGLLSLPLGPDLEAMPRRKVDVEDGKEAITRYEMVGEELQNGLTVTRVVFYPLTGRTHQLRVHASAAEGLNAPILGDRLYGHMADRLYLHAEAISFKHPLTHEPMCFELPAPF